MYEPLLEKLGFVNSLIIFTYEYIYLSPFQLYYGPALKVVKDVLEVCEVRRAAVITDTNGSFCFTIKSTFIQSLHLIQFCSQVAAASLISVLEEILR